MALKPSLWPHKMARFLHAFSPKSTRKTGRNAIGHETLGVMDQDKGFFGLIVGGIVALAAAVFILSGGDLGGKKTVEGDQDLPPVASTDK